MNCFLSVDICPKTYTTQYQLVLVIKMKNIEVETKIRLTKLEKGIRLDESLIYPVDIFSSLLTNDQYHLKFDDIRRYGNLINETDEDRIDNLGIFREPDCVRIRGNILNGSITNVCIRLCDETVPLFQHLVQEINECIKAIPMNGLARDLSSEDITSINKFTRSVFTITEEIKNTVTPEDKMKNLMNLFPRLIEAINKEDKYARYNKHRSIDNQVSAFEMDIEHYFQYKREDFDSLIDDEKRNEILKLMLNKMISKYNDFLNTEHIFKDEYSQKSYREKLEKCSNELALIS